MKNNEKNNKKIIIEENNNGIENAASIEIKRKRGRPKKTDNNNLIQLKKKKNKLNNSDNPASIENTGIPGHEKINKKSGKNKNNSVKNNNIIPAQDPDNVQVKHRGRGRPKGTTGITRKDNIHNIVPQEVKQRLMHFNMTLSHLPPVEKNNPVSVQDRTDYFFNLCVDYDISPTIAGYALSLGIDRVTLWTWLTGKVDYIKNTQVINIIKNAYSTINNLYEQLLTEGKIVPVSAFFLMQNNHGYKQQTDHVITANTQDNVTDNDIMNKAGLIE